MLPVGVRYDVALRYDVTNNPSDKLTCAMLGLDRHQVRLCRRESGSGLALLEATNTATEECRKQFATERWNCSMTHAQRNRLMKKGK